MTVAGRIAVVCALAVACSSNAVAPPKVDASTSVVLSSCMTCASNECIEAWRTCGGSPSCGEALVCAARCEGTESTSCIDACAPKERETWDPFRRCFIDNAIRSCMECGGRQATYTNPILTQMCTGEIKPGWPGADGACKTCQAERCCMTIDACKTGSECMALIQCASACPKDLMCLQACASQHAKGLVPAAEFSACLEVRCGDECATIAKPPCQKCRARECGDEYAAYIGTPDGLSYDQCLKACIATANIAQCLATCTTLYPAGAKADAIVDLCEHARCKDVCF